MNHTSLSQTEVEAIIDAYKREEITDGQARQQLGGISLIEFNKLLAEREIPVYTEEAYQLDLKNLRKLNRLK